MYLSKNASSTYYTHLPQPNSLRGRGLPFATRTSICTKGSPNMLPYLFPLPVAEGEGMSAYSANQIAGLTQQLLTN
ncbi:Uncharacterised protein [Serratia marcescens]|nr:Uncharacterised protein [Serratia marcescens]